MNGDSPKHFVFAGCSEHTIDPKCRLAIPSSYRSRLPPDSGSRFYVNLGREKRIEIHPAAEWHEVQMPKLARLNEDNKKQRMRLRARLAYSYEVEMDGAGRVLIPKRLLAYANLGPGSACVISSLGGFLEVTNAQLFDEQMAPVIEDPSRFIDDDEDEPAVEAGHGRAAPSGDGQ